MIKNIDGMQPLYSQFDDTANLNNLTFLDYYKRLRLLALSMFEWENLPDSMNARFLEKCLYIYGQAAFVYDEKLGFINLKCVPSDYLNIYEESFKYNCYSINYNKEYNLADMILVRNNLESIPTDMTIQLFARRLCECERTTDVNINAQQTPVLVLTDEKTRLTLMNVYKKYDGHEPVIYGNKNFDPECVKVLKTDAPYIADKLQAYKRNVWAECMAFLGINNVADEKRERLVTDEVNANNQMIELSAEIMLLTRQKACEEFNKKFNQNISVRLRAPNEIQKESEGVESGDLYNGTSGTD